MQLIQSMLLEIKDLRFVWSRESRRQLIICVRIRSAKRTPSTVAAMFLGNLSTVQERKGSKSRGAAKVSNFLWSNTQLYCYWLYLRGSFVEDTAVAHTPSILLIIFRASSNERCTVLMEIFGTSYGILNFWCESYSVIKWNNHFSCHKNPYVTIISLENSLAPWC